MSLSLHETDVELAQRCGLQNHIACTSVGICRLVHQGPSDLFDVIDFLCNFIVQQISKRLVCVHISKYSAIVTILFFFTKEPKVFLYLIAPNFCMASTRLATVAPNKSRTRTTTEGSGTVNPYVNADKQVH